MNNRDITTITTEGTGDGYAGQFKVLYPVESIEGKTGSVQLSFRTDVYKYAVFYAVCAEKDQYGNLQNYVVDTDPTTTMDLSAYSNYADGPTIEYETGLRIIKYETGTETPISGALFEVIGPDGDTIGLFVTNEEGRIEIPIKKVGNHTVIEREAPSHYVISEQPAQNVTVVYDEVAEVTFFNDPCGTLRIEKKSNTGMNLAGVVITIEHIESGQTFTQETSSAGVAIFDQLPLGAYRIQEKSVPEGWQLDDTVYTATVVTGTTTIPIINEELPGLRIIKYDRINHKCLPNVSFSVWHDGELYGTFETDEFGEIFIPNATPGTWLAYETDTGNPAHILNTTPQQIELEAGDGIRELLFFNDLKPGMHLTKVDSKDPSKVIAGAVFEIKAVDGSFGPEEFITGQDGTIDLSSLPENRAYVVTEKMCDGYVIDQAQRIIQLTANQNVEFVFTNTIKPSVRILKISSDGTPLEGVGFRISYVEDGTHYLDRVTDSRGIIEISDMDVGVLSIQEISTVSDHIMDPKEYHVQLFPGKTSELVVENQKRPNLTIWKYDADDGVTPVEGATFLVEYADGHSIEEVTTGPDGSATVKNMLPSVIKITEKSVPSPYLLDAEPQLVTLYPNRDRDVYFYNHKAPTITIIKENEITHDRIENVPFQVWYASNDTSTGEYNDLGIFYTDKDGRIELTDPDISLRDGWFRVKELEPAPGFSIADPDTQEAFIAAGEGHTFRFYNRPLSSICVWKYDSESGQAIEGAVFQVRYLSGNTSGTGGTVIGIYRTSVNGSFTVTGCKSGTYIIEELSSDGSHVIDTPPQTVYLSGEEQEVVQVYFGNSPKGSLLILKKSDTGEPLSDVEFFVTDSTGAVIGDANGKFWSNSAGEVLIEGINPGTTLIVTESKAKPGYVLSNVSQTAVIRAGQTVKLEFVNSEKGNLIVQKYGYLDGKKVPLEGVEFKITYADGRFVDAEEGKLSSNGVYFSNAEGQVILSNVVGTIIVTEVASVPGFTIDENSRTQTVTVNAGDDTQTLYFYNHSVGGVEIIKVNQDKVTERIPDTTFEIRRVSDDALIDTVTTGSSGTVFLALENGSYYAQETKANSRFVLSSEKHYFSIENGEKYQLQVGNRAKSQILIHKVDTSGEGIYGVKFLLYDQNRNPIGEFTSDDEGWVYITADDLPDGANTSGRFYLRELEAAEGYILDEEYKTVYVRPGHTAEIEWVNEAITGQIQIYKYAAEYNEVTGTPAGTPLQGAVYEISNARTGKVVDYITTDARGVAASKPLPLTRYKIVEVTAPAYWQVDPTVHDITLEYAGQIIKISAYDKPSNLGVTITKRGNTEVLAGQTMRYDLTVANTSNVPLENFYWHDKIPYDVARATTLTTGTYSARLNYRVLYKTNYQSSYQVLASNLLTSNNYSFALNAIPMQAGEVVTDIYFDFGKVPVGFQSVTGPTLSVIINGNTVNGYQLVNRADVGGKYQGTWQTTQASWVTIIRKYTTTPDLPKTGY